MAYIDTDKLLNDIPDDLPYKASVKRVLLQAPKVDVVHGKWLMPLSNEPWRRGYFCRCSVCDYINNGHTQKVPSFCECCGARMNGERSEKE